MSTVSTILFALSFLHSADAHSRWQCPPPRSPETGIKNGPCGFETNVFTETNPPITIKPGPLRVIFEESLHHTGAPFRIALSDDGSDDSSCVLLDHIPHNDCCQPNIRDPTTYTPYVITVQIPNVNCEKCSLHLANPMTDKIGEDGSPTGIGCTDPDGTCTSVYHSCTMPFRIVGNEGAVPRSQYQCDSGDGGEGLHVDWPKAWMGDEGEKVDVSVPGVYRRESSAHWHAKKFTLGEVSLRYVEPAGDICEEKLNGLLVYHSGAGGLKTSYGNFSTGTLAVGVLFALKQLLF